MPGSSPARWSTLDEVADIQERYASSRLDMARFVLVTLFIIEQRWRYIIDKELECDGVTTKQWLMLIVMSVGFIHAPSIQEVAVAMSTTHQNVKQIASSLERRGFVTMARDESNRRIIRLSLTEKCKGFWESRNENDVRAILDIFEGMTDEELKSLFGHMAKLEKIAERRYGKARNSKQDNARND